MKFRKEFIFEAEEGDSIEKLSAHALRLINKGNKTVKFELNGAVVTVEKGMTKEDIQIAYHEKLREYFNELREKNDRQMFGQFNFR